MAMNPEGIDETVAIFFAAFSNVDGPAPVDSLYDICLAEAVIVNATNRSPAIYSLEQFVEPRRALLSSGTLVGFREYEISSETSVHDRIANRISRYEKTWTEDGVRKQGAGMKILSLLLTAEGWKITSVLWQDT